MSNLAKLEICVADRRLLFPQSIITPRQFHEIFFYFCTLLLYLLDKQIAQFPDKCSDV